MRADRDFLSWEWEGGDAGAVEEGGRLRFFEEAFAA